MAGLKTLVIVMGIAIIVGATVVVTTIIQRGGSLGGARDGPVARGVIHLPAGARVVEARLDGGRILLRLELSGGGTRILIVDAGTGAPISVHDLSPQGRGP